MRSVRYLVAASLLMVCCAADTISASVKGKYENREGDFSLQFRSEAEVEIDEEGLMYLGKYSVEPDGRVRVVARVMGMDMVDYYRITDKGLVHEDDGDVLYSEAVMPLMQASTNPTTLLAIISATNSDGIVTDVDIRNGSYDEDLDFQELLRVTSPSTWFGEVTQCRTSEKIDFGDRVWGVDLGESSYAWYSPYFTRAGRDRFAQTVEKAVADWGLRHGEFGALSEAEYREFRCVSDDTGASELQPPSIAPPDTEPPPKEAGCQTYRSCLATANSRLKSGRLEQSLAEAEKASTLEPSEPKAWGLIGDIYLQMGRYDEVSQMWDKFFQLGGEGRFGMCRGKAMLRCFPGTLGLSTSGLSFATRKGDQLLDSSLAEVEMVKAIKIGHTEYDPSSRLVLTVLGKKYNLDPIPPSASDCFTELASYICPEPGSSQQAHIAEYLSRTIDALSKGTFDSGEPPPKTKADLLHPLKEGEFTDASEFKKEITSDIDGSQLLHLGQDYCVTDAMSRGDSLRGTEFRPIASGKIVDARFSEPAYRKDGVGNYLIIDHGQGIVAAYLHLARSRKKTGDPVTSDEIIGEAGDEILHSPDKGNCPHLHLEIRTSDGSSLAVSPNLRFGYVSKNGTAKLDPALGSEEEVLSWIEDNFSDPKSVLRARQPN